MLIELPPDERSRVAHLYEDYTGCRGMVAAVLFGNMGQALADDPVAPSLAVLRLGFDNLVAGPAGEQALAIVAESLPATAFLVVPPDWNEPLETNHARSLTPQKRTLLSAPASWNRSGLCSLLSLPDGFEVQRVTADNVSSFADVDRSLVKQFDSTEDFLDRGVGFGVQHQGRFVSGCSSYAVGGGKLEIEIDTRPDFRRRGFAAASAAALILHCLALDIEPCWDAANETSARLAMRLGFVNPCSYTAYLVHPVPRAS